MHTQPFVLKRKKKRVLPYWLAGGEETCAGCDRHYTFAVETRCVACDGPFCPTCVVIVTGEAFCSGCHEQQGGRRWLRARSGKA